MGRSNLRGYDLERAGRTSPANRDGGREYHGYELGNANNNRDDANSAQPQRDNPPRVGPTA